MSENSFRSPFAAMVWKEWRESWWLLVLVAVGPTVWPILLTRTGMDVSEGRIVTLLVYGLVLGLGGALFAGERMRGTDAFQNERPMRRGEVWNAKIFLPALAVLSGAILFRTVLWLWPDRPLEPIPGLWFFMVVVWLLFFASAVLCSVLLDRPLTAGAAGGVVGLAALFFQYLLFDYLTILPPSRLGMQSTDWPWFLFLFLLLFEGIGMLWLSRIIYVRWTHD